MTKFSTNRAYIFRFILWSCFVLINYQAISQNIGGGFLLEFNSTFQKNINDSLDIDSTKTDTSEKIIYHLKLYEDIMPNAGRLIKRALSNANKLEADVFIMELNTYGGRVDIADTIKSLLVNAKPLTVSFISNNAISAGAFISIACDSIYMKKDASFGAVTVVNSINGQQAPDKYQSAMRSKMRAVAEVKGRDPMIAEAMVDDRVFIPGIIDSGKTLTFTTSEAIKHGYCDGIASNIDEVISALNIKNYQLTEHRITGLDKAVGFTIDKIIALLTNRIISSILMLMIFWGFFLELQTPGIGFPLVMAIIAAILFFAPLYLTGMAASSEMVLFFVGFALLAAEIFIIPGFGIAGVLGLIFIVVALTFSLIQINVFDFPIKGVDDIGESLLQVMVTLSIGVGLLVAFGGSLFNTPAFQKIMLKDEQKSEDGYAIRKLALDHLVGSIGKATTDLRTSGKIEINGDIYDALSEGGFIDRNSEVKVIRVDVNTLLVRKIG